MKSKAGSLTRNISLTQEGMVWVLGERWCTFSTQTLVMMEKVTSTMVNIRYLPIRGTSSEVGGTIFEIKSKNTVRAKRTEMQRVIFSPQSEGK